MNFLFWNEIIIPLAGMAVGVILGLPIIRAIVRRLERPALAETDTFRVELAELRRRVEVAEELGGRLSELEERLEFAERLLTRQRESGKLPS
ncbi:MAG TPA: hypothetical protein VD793_04270 [Gemmatimonadales bacterium]|nr:hypothetical protein [Gemmatimonadales bacterium]